MAGLTDSPGLTRLWRQHPARLPALTPAPQGRGGCGRPGVGRGLWLTMKNWQRVMWGRCCAPCSCRRSSRLLPEVGGFCAGGPGGAGGRDVLPGQGVIQEGSPTWENNLPERRRRAGSRGPWKPRGNRKSRSILCSLYPSRTLARGLRFWTLKIYFLRGTVCNQLSDAPTSLLCLSLSWPPQLPPKSKATLSRKH